MKDLHVFMHIPKCGGLTVRQYYEKVFENNLTIQANHYPAADFPKLKNALEYDAIVGHLPLFRMIENETLVEAIRSDQVRVTIHSIIRDPIDRIISELNFKRRNPRHPQHKEMQCVDAYSYVKNFQPNYQSRFLSVSDQTDTADQIGLRVNLVNIQDSVDFFLRYFQSRYPERQLERAEIFNVTEKQFSKASQKLLKRDEFSDDDIAQLQMKAGGDDEFFGTVCSRCGRFDIGDAREFLLQELLQFALGAASQDFGDKCAALI